MPFEDACSLFLACFEQARRTAQLSFVTQAMLSNVRVHRTAWNQVGLWDEKVSNM